LVLLREKIKHMALDTPTTAPCKLISTAKRNVPVEVLQAQPSEQTLYNYVRRLRLPLGMKDPQTRDEIIERVHACRSSGNCVGMKSRSAKLRLRWGSNLRCSATGEWGESCKLSCSLVVSFGFPVEILRSLFRWKGTWFVSLPMTSKGGRWQNADWERLPQCTLITTMEWIESSVVVWV